MIILNDVTYVDGQEDPLEALKTTLAFSVDDWGASRAMSWVWGIVLGWDEDSEVELADKFGWSNESIERLRRLHVKFESFEDGVSS